MRVLTSTTTAIMDPNDHDERSKRRRLASYSPAASPTIDRYVAAHHDSPMAHNPPCEHPHHAANSIDNEDDASCSQRLFTQPPDILLDVHAPVLYARAGSLVSLHDIPQRQLKCIKDAIKTLYIIPTSDWKPSIISPSQTRPVLSLLDAPPWQIRGHRVHMM